MATTEVFDWIERELSLRMCNSGEFVYDDMESQSDHMLPIIYQPFDSSKRSHWADRGSCIDYVLSCGDGRLLDFGPGDGWPSLIIAPFVDYVAGVEGSARRVDVCTQNARRLGISNAEFVHVEPEQSLPFSDNVFDGVTAASSIEQTPDPGVTLGELYRVLRPGGHLRIFYEALSGYRGGREQEIWTMDLDDDRSMLVLYDRLIDRECVRQYGIVFAMPEKQLTEKISAPGEMVSFEKVTVPVLEKMKNAIIDTRKCELIHPSGPTLASWLKNAGFKEVLPTGNGQEAACRLFDESPEKTRPTDVAGVDKVLLPAVEAALATAVPLGNDPMITAVK